jgi:hypothetical protein
MGLVYVLFEVHKRMTPLRSKCTNLLMSQKIIISGRCLKESVLVVSIPVQAINQLDRHSPKVSIHHERG